MAASPFDIAIDEVTLARARRGDLAACERIFRDFQQPVYSVAFRICQCPDLAREVGQEAFITVFRKFGQYRQDAPFWGWLRRVVVNQAISTIRRLPKSGHDSWEEQHDNRISDGHHERVGEAMDLEAALATLGPEDRAIVWLHDVEGYNHTEIAGLFGKSESFSKTRLSRARARLRTLLSRETGRLPERAAGAN